MAAIDLRSDTVTRPTGQMRAAMASAEVGDEQFHEEPTVNELQRRMAELLGHEAAVFLPTATMANQVALRAQTRPGSVILAEERTHILIYEWGGPAIHSGLVMHGVPAEKGRPTPEQILADEDLGAGGVVVLENTHRSSGGRIWPLEEFAAAAAAARARGAAVHLDGARLFNASVASGISLAELARPFDLVSVALSKGLGCPVGSVVAGSAAEIARAVRARRMFGGAMRQSGILAAAGLYALDHHIPQLAEDHANARSIAERLAGLPGVALDLATVETNIIVFQLAPGLPDAATIAARAKEAGVLISALGPRTVRAVTHRDVSRDSCRRAADLIAAVIERG